MPQKTNNKIFKNGFYDPDPGINVLIGPKEDSLTKNKGYFKKGFKMRAMKSVNLKNLNYNT